MDLDFAGLKEFIFSDDSIKTIVFLIAFDMRNKFAQMNKSIDKLTERLASLETTQTLRFENLENRVGSLELKNKTHGG